MTLTLQARYSFVIIGLVLGIAGRLDLTDTPPVFQRWWVIAVFAVLYVFEFFVDKIPLIDSAWAVVSTIIRPVGAAPELPGRHTFCVNGST